MSQICEDCALIDLNFNLKMNTLQSLVKIKNILVMFQVKQEQNQNLTFLQFGL